jgi:hypothetical protein
MLAAGPPLKTSFVKPTFLKLNLQCEKNRAQIFKRLLYEGGPENDVDSSFTNSHLMGHGRLDSTLVSYAIPRIEFSSQNPSR